jgi:hypothetical protein
MYPEPISRLKVGYFSNWHSDPCTLYVDLEPGPDEIKSCVVGASGRRKEE